MAITPALKRYIETRMRRLDRYGTKFGGAQVILGIEKHRHTAEALLSLSGTPIQAKASTKEMYASIDQLLDKVSRQVRKHKEKLIKQKRGVTSRSIARRTARKSGEMEQESTVLQTVQPALTRLTVEEAIGRLGGQAPAMVVFLHATSNRIQIVRRLDSGVVELIDPQTV